jgi:hypothetical protein
MDLKQFAAEAEPVMLKHLKAMQEELNAIWGLQVHFCAQAIPLHMPDATKPDQLISAGIVTMDSFGGEPGPRMECAQNLVAAQMETHMAMIEKTFAEVLGVPNVTN